MADTAAPPHRLAGDAEAEQPAALSTDLAADLAALLRAAGPAAAELATLAATEPGPAIHELRRSLRRLRALLRLLPGAWPGDLAEQADHALGAARRALAHARDADVLPAAVARLPDKTQRSMQHIAAHLQHKRLFVLADPLWPEVALAAAQRTQVVLAALLEQLASVDEALIAKGVRRLLRQVNAAHAQCERKPSHRRIHTLRKSAKYLADALWWLGSAAGPELRALNKAVDQLGRATDLQVLHRWLRLSGAGRRFGVRRSYVRAAERLVQDYLAKAQASLVKLGPADANAGHRLGLQAGGAALQLRQAVPVGLLERPAVVEAPADPN